jgi:hypothetical protein
MIQTKHFTTYITLIRGDKPYKCDVFGKGFSGNSKKTGHHDIAEILLKVPLKHQKSKSNQSNLQTHIRIHTCTGDKPYKCYISMYYNVCL